MTESRPAYDDPLDPKKVVAATTHSVPLLLLINRVRTSCVARPLRVPANRSLTHGTALLLSCLISSRAQLRESLLSERRDDMQQEYNDIPSFMPQMSDLPPGTKHKNRCEGSRAAAAFRLRCLGHTVSRSGQPLANH
jgi:hypothetical protein